MIGQSGQPIQNQEVTEFLQNALGRVSTVAETSALKRLGFEAHTWKSLVFGCNIETADWSQWWYATTQSGVCRENPAHGQVASGPWTKTFISLESWSHHTVCWTNAAQFLTEKGLILKQDDKLTCSTDSEITLHCAFSRRAVARAFARVMFFQQHNAWVCFLFESLQREVPPGYSRANLSQVVSCDKAAWARLATLGIPTREATDGTFPLEDALLVLKGDPSIVLYLAPVAKPVQSSSAGPSRPVPWNSAKAPTWPGQGEVSRSALLTTPLQAVHTLARWSHATGVRKDYTSALNLSANRHSLCSNISD